MLIMVGKINQKAGYVDDKHILRWPMVDTHALREAGL